jgi:hypothetical protein
MILGFRGMAVLIAGLSLFCSLAKPAGPVPADSGITRASADRCSLKLKAMEEYSAHPNPGRVQTTRFSEEEVNSYLALDMSSKYNPCLKSLKVKFEEARLQGVALIDFDKLGKTSTKFMPKLLGFMLSGLHAITVQGQLVSGNGKASFRLEQAQFDNMTLPKALVEEIVTAVGRKQNPPFDPMQPSQLFYDVQKIDVHPGYVLAYQ